MGVDIIPHPMRLGPIREAFWGPLCMLPWFFFVGMGKFAEGDRHVFPSAQVGSKSCDWLS